MRQGCCIRTFSSTLPMGNMASRYYELLICAAFEKHSAMRGKVGGGNLWLDWGINGCYEYFVLLFF